MKQPNWKTPLILSTTLVAIGGFAYWLQYSHKPKKEKADSLVKKPLGLPSEKTQIAYFKIKSGRGLIEAKCEDIEKKLCLVGSEANWTITYPKTFKADPESVKAFINDAANVLATETIDLTEETQEKRNQLLEEYGLSSNKRTDLQAQFIEFTLENGKKITAWFGQEHPLGDKTFVARSEDGNVNDKTIYLISNFFKSNFDKTVTHFRDKKLFNFDRSAITAFDAKTTSGKLQAVLNQNAWTINGFNGDYERIETVLAAISQLKAIEFLDQAAIKGLKPIIHYDLVEKEKHYTLALYEKSIKRTTPPPSYHGDEDEHDHDRHPNSVKDAILEKHYYAVVSDLPDVYEVQALIRSQIDKSVSDLRDGLLLSQTEKVTTTHLKIEGKAYSTPADFEFKSGSWTTKSKLDANNVPKLLDIMTSSRVKDFLPIPNVTRTQEITLSLGDEKNANKVHFTFFTVKTGKQELIYAINLNSKLKEAMLLDEGIYKNALPFTPDSWKLGK